MGEFYQDKVSEQIKKDVSEQFKKDDTRGYRDDQEIYDSAVKVINKYISEIKTSKKEVFGIGDIKVFTDLQTQLINERNNMKGLKLLTENKKTIHDVANRIDNAEKIVLEKLALSRSNANITKAINSTPQNKKYFNRDVSGILTFTSEVNKPTIHEVLGNVFKNNNDVYEIDYSGCKNQNIKNKMSSLSNGRTKFYISYDTEKKTYLLSDSNGNKLDQRALIREGITLIPGGVISYQAKQENRKGVEEKNKKIAEQSNLGNKTIQQLQGDPKRGSIIKSINPSLKAQLEKDHTIYKIFLSKTEQRLDQIIADAKSKNRELHTEPISKVGIHRNGLMEVHLISGTAEKDVTLRNNANHLGNKVLYNLLDGEESGYKQYLTSRIQQKRHEYEYLTKQENVLSSNKEVNKENLAGTQEKMNAMYGLGLMGKLVDKLRDEEGNTRKNNDDRKIVDMVKYIRDAKYSIQTNDNMSKSDLQLIAITLKKLFNAYDSTDEKYFISLLSGPKEKSIIAIRKIGESLTTFDNTHTAFIRDEIIENDDLEIKETLYNTCFQNISKCLAIPDGQGEIPANIKANIDGLYAASTSPQGVLNFLKSKGMLPGFASLDDKKIKEGCEKIYNTIQSKNQVINSFDITAEYMRSSLEKEKIDLDSKDNKTPDDVARLNAILFLLGNPVALQEQAKNQTEIMKNITKYAGIDSEIKGAIGSRLIKKGGGMSGTNADIYNDSIGAGGWFDRSDENVSKTSEILKQIAIEVAICVVAIAVGAFTAGAGTAAIYGARAAVLSARVVSAASKGGKILKIMKLAGRLANYKKYYTIGKEVSMGLKLVNKSKSVIGGLLRLKEGVSISNTMQLVAKGTALVLEGTTFHLSSTVLHNAVNGKMDLFEGTDPTGYMVLPDGTQMPNRKSYAQSIAFLGVLKAVGQPVQELTKAGLAKLMSQKATASMMGRAVQSMASFTGEVGTLMGTEQILSLTFDQKLTPLTWDGFIHMIGMVAGLRGYNILKQKGQLMVKDYKQGKDGKVSDVKINDVWLSEVGKKTLQTINETPGTYSKNATKEQLTHKREQLNQEITRLKNEGVNSTDPRIITRENAVKLLDGKIATFGYTNQVQIDKVKELQRKNVEQKNNLELEIKSLETKRSELEIKRQEIIGEKPRESIEGSIRDIELIVIPGNKLSIAGVKYQYIGIKDGKIQFKPDAGGQIKEFASLKELQNANVNFELKNTPKIGGKGKNTIFNEIVKGQELIVKKRPGDINKQLNNLKTEKSRLESEIKNIEANNNNYNQNEFFSKNKQELLGENFWRDGQKHTVSEITKNGDIKITNNSTGETFTINSFKQLADKGGIQFFAEQGAKTSSTGLTKSEKASQDKWNNLQKGEMDYMSNRQTELGNKKTTLDQINRDIANKEVEYTKSQTRQQQIDVRRDKLVEVNTELNKVNNELVNKQNQLQETIRLESKYEADLVTLNESGNVVENVVSKPVEIKVETKPAPQAKPEAKVEGYEQNESNLLERKTQIDKDINYLETQRAETETQYNFKKNKTPNDIKTFNQNMDAYNQKIEALKREKAKIEGLQEPISQTKPEVKVEPVKIKYIDKPLKENFTQQERLQYKNELLSKIQERYPDWYKEVIDQGYKFEPYRQAGWGETNAIDKIIYINPCKKTSGAGSKAKGVEIPIETMLHEMSHVITEKNLGLDLLYKAREKDPYYTDFLESANKEQVLFIELSHIYREKSQTFSPHAMHTEYTEYKATEKSPIDKIWSEILPVREDMVELHAKYRRGELETFLNERAPQMGVTKEQVNSIIKGFKDAFGSKNSVLKVVKETNVYTRKIPSNRPGNKIKIDQIKGETLDVTVQRALNDKRMDKLVVVENGEVFMVNPKITTSKNIEVRFEDGSIETGPRKNGKLEGDNCIREYKDSKNYDIVEKGNFVDGLLKDGQKTYTNEYKKFVIEKGDFINGGFVKGERTIYNSRKETVIEKGDFINGEFVKGEYKNIYEDTGVVGMENKPTITTETGSRKNGKLEGDGARIDDGATYSKSEGVFRNGELYQGKIITKDGTIVRSYSQGKEVIKTESLIKFSDGPKIMFNSRDFLESAENVISILEELKNRGQYYDKNFSDFNLNAPIVKYWGTFQGRPIVEVKMPNGNSEYFYKSTGWAGKSGDGVGGTTNGMWQVFGGFADAHMAGGGKIGGRFIKDGGYKNYYDSKTFEKIAQSLNNVMIEKMEVKNISELDKKINFQNREINTFVPEMVKKSKITKDQGKEELKNAA